MKYLLLFVLLLWAAPVRAQSVEESNEAGWKLLREERPALALQQFDRALAREKDSLEALYGRGVARVQCFNAAGAVEDLTQVVEARPREPNARFWRGLAFGDQREHARAVEDFSLALGSNEPLGNELRVNCLIHRGLNRNALGQLKEARSDMDEAIKLDETKAEAWAGRARVRRAQGDEAGAQNDSKQAGALDPELGTSLEAHEGFQLSQVVYWVVAAIMAIITLFCIGPLVRNVALLLKADKE